MKKRLRDSEFFPTSVLKRFWCWCSFCPVFSQQQLCSFIPQLHAASNAFTRRSRVFVLCGPLHPIEPPFLIAVEHVGRPLCFSCHLVHQLMRWCVCVCVCVCWHAVPLPQIHAVMCVCVLSARSFLLREAGVESQKARPSRSLVSVFRRRNRHRCSQPCPLPLRSAISVMNVKAAISPFMFFFFLFYPPPCRVFSVCLLFYFLCVRVCLCLLFFSVQADEDPKDPMPSIKAECKSNHCAEMFSAYEVQRTNGTPPMALTARMRHRDFVGGGGGGGCHIFFTLTNLFSS